MEPLPTLYRLEESYRITSSEAGMLETGWNSQLRSEEIGRGCRVNTLDCTTDHREKRIIEGPPTLSVSLFLQGAGRFAVEDGPELALQPGHLFLFQTMRHTRGLNEIAGGCRLQAVDFRFGPAMLDRYGLQSLTCLVRAFSDDASVGDAIFMRRPLDSALRLIAEQTIGCPMRGTARRAFLQSKALEVLAHIVALAEVSDPPSNRLNRRDRDRIEEAAAMLQTRYHESWTIAELARAVGLNERKLKQGFRLILGRTVHAHLEEARIAAARSLLAEDGCGATETALAVGYSNPSHFAKVFRRHVGTTPSQWLRSRLREPA